MGKVAHNRINAFEMVPFVARSSRPNSRPGVLLIVMHTFNCTFDQSLETACLGRFPRINPLVALGLWLIPFLAQWMRPLIADYGSADIVLFHLSDLSTQV